MKRDIKPAAFLWFRIKIRIKCGEHLAKDGAAGTTVTGDGT